MKIQLAIGPDTTLLDAVTTYMPIGNGYLIDDSETTSKVTWRIAGIISQLSVVCHLNNTTGGSSTFTLQKNETDGNNVVSVPFGTTGAFADTSNTDSITSGDRLRVKAVTGTGGDSVDLAVVSAVFEPTSGNARWNFAIWPLLGFNFSGQVVMGLTDYDDVSSTNVPDARVFLPFDCTFRNLEIVVWANVSGALYLSLGKNNNLNGNGLDITVPAGTTGTFTDTDSIAYVQGDSVFIHADADLGAVDMDQFISVECENTDDGRATFHEVRDVLGNTITQANPFGSISGDCVDQALELQTQARIGTSVVFSNLKCNIILHTSSGANTIRFRKNGADTNLVVSVPASTTGTFEDTTNTVTVTPGDLVNYQYEQNGTDTFEVLWVQVVSVEPANAPYTRELLGSLPANKNSLAIVYDTQETTNVATDDDVFVNLGATTGGTLMHLFKKEHTNNTDNINITVKVKSSVAPNVSVVYLQIWNKTSASWETLDTEASANANVEFTLSGAKTSSLSDYYDTNNEVAVRVYQTKSGAPP